MILVLALIAYLIGSLPTGYWFTRYFFNIDITQKGSGNIGATNVARTLGTRYFLFIFFLDALKAALFLIVCSDYLHLPSLQLIFLALLLLVGNAYSPFLEFRGGKGVATTVGIMAALAPWWITTFFISCWLFLLLLAKNAAVASLAAIILVMMYSYSSLGYISQDLVALFVFIAIWLFWTHRTNIKKWSDS